MCENEQLAKVSTPTIVKAEGVSTCHVCQSKDLLKNVPYEINEDSVVPMSLLFKITGMGLLGPWYAIRKRKVQVALCQTCGTLRLYVDRESI